MPKWGPKSMAHLWNFGICDFLFFAKSITLKSFFYMTWAPKKRPKYIEKQDNFRSGAKTTPGRAFWSSQAPTYSEKSLLRTISESLFWNEGVQNGNDAKKARTKKNMKKRIHSKWGKFWTLAEKGIPNPPSPAPPPPKPSSILASLAAVAPTEAFGLRPASVIITYTFGS